VPRRLAASTTLPPPRPKPIEYLQHRACPIQPVPPRPVGDRQRAGLDQPHATVFTLANVPPMASSASRMVKAGRVQGEGRELVDHAVGAERRGDAAPRGASGVRGPRPRYGLLVICYEPEHVQ
jgi:hypothetical protein